MSSQRWRLPESFCDSLPSEARAIEELKRNLLDLYRSYGYELVSPPLVEYVESVLGTVGSDLDLRTFKVVDQLSGRMLALRSDMTPQVARIDAQLLNRQGVTRLCYSGSVVHTRARGLFANREPLQIGAELYGHSGLEADIEVIELMIASLKAAGAGSIRIDLAHHTIFAQLLKEIPTEIDQEQLFAMLESKDLPGLSHLLRDQPNGHVWLGLIELYGSADSHATAILRRARQVLPETDLVINALDQLQRLCVAQQLLRFEGVELAIDLADVRGYRYHTGITFTAWIPESSDAIARGGRYDNIGARFGRNRAATGFSLELREMARIWNETSGAVSRAIIAPWSDDPVLAEVVAKLRVSGEIVVQVLPGHEQEQQEFVFDRELIQTDGKWVITSR